MNIELISLIEHEGFEITDRAKGILLSNDFNIEAIALRRGIVVAPAGFEGESVFSPREVIAIITMVVTRELKFNDYDRIVIVHEPILDSSGNLGMIGIMPNEKRIYSFYSSDEADMLVKKTGILYANPN